MRLAFVFMFALAFPAFAEDMRRVISVSGQGSVAATPDMAELTIGVSREARRPEDALDDMAEGVARIFALLETAEIEARDFRTSGLSLQPRWERSSNSGSPRITGYVASNQVTIRVRDLSKVGALITDAVGDGANGLSGLRFVVADPAPLEDEARRLAVEDAMAKARLYADVAGVVLGPLISLGDAGSFSGGPGPLMADMAVRSEAVPIAGGEVEIRANVSMVYEIER